METTVEKKEESRGEEYADEGAHPLQSTDPQAALISESNHHLSSEPLIPDGTQSGLIDGIQPMEDNNNKKGFLLKENDDEQQTPHPHPHHEEQPSRTVEESDVPAEFGAAQPLTETQRNDTISNNTLNHLPTNTQEGTNPHVTPSQSLAPEHVPFPVPPPPAPENRLQRGLKELDEQVDLLKAGKHSGYIEELVKIEAELILQQKNAHSLYEIQVQEIEDEFTVLLQTFDTECLEKIHKLKAEVLAELEKELRTLEENHTNHDHSIVADINRLEGGALLSRRLRERERKEVRDRPGRKQKRALADDDSSTGSRRKMKKALLPQKMTKDLLELRDWEVDEDMKLLTSMKSARIRKPPQLKSM